jgi:hypothetical protein
VGFLATIFHEEAAHYARIGKMLGPEAYIADDGSVHEDVLCANVPELVAERLGLKMEG